MRMLSLFRRHIFITTLILSVGTYVMCIFCSSIIEPLLRSTGMRFEGIAAPGELLSGLFYYTIFITFAVLLGVCVLKIRYMPIYYCLLFACLILYCPERFHYYDRRSGFCKFVESILEDKTILSAAAISIVYIFMIQFIPYVITFAIIRLSRTKKGDKTLNK